MPVVTDIAASYRGPRRVMAAKLRRGIDDRLAVVYLLAGAALGFVAQLPRLRREALQSNPELEEAIRAEAGDVRQIEATAVPAELADAKFQALVSGALFGWIFIVPLALYVIAALSHFILRRFGGSLDGVEARLALFWAFLAATPVMLFQGLVGGFIGPGPVWNGVTVLWIGVFFWFWLSNMREAGWGTA